MRRLETDRHARLLPGRGRRSTRGGSLTRVEGCAGYLRRALARPQRGRRREDRRDHAGAAVQQRVRRAAASSGYETLAVVPTFNTLDSFSLEMGLPPDPAAIGCHEITHYVQLQQIAGFAWFWNCLFGDVYTPQIGLDPWFNEGLAVYYETKLQPGIGRLAWPFWRGVVRRGLRRQAHQRRRPVSVFQRNFHGGNHYLVGQPVRAFPRRSLRRGQVVEADPRPGAIDLLPAVGQRAVLAARSTRSLSTLIDEFADEADAALPPRTRPPEQRVLRAGRQQRALRAGARRHRGAARLRPRPPGLADDVCARRHGRAGARSDARCCRRASWRSPRRRWPAASASRPTGARCISSRWISTPRIRRRGSTATTSTLGHSWRSWPATCAARRIAQPRRPPLRVRARRRRPPRSRRARHRDRRGARDRAGAPRRLHRQPAVLARRHPARRDALRRPCGFASCVLDARDGRLLSTLATGDDPVARRRRGSTTGASSTSAARRATPASRSTTTTWRRGRIDELTHAPFLAFQPNAAGGRTLRFLNREGWRWTLDEIPLPPRAPPRPAQAAAGARRSRRCLPLHHHGRRTRGRTGRPRRGGTAPRRQRRHAHRRRRRAAGRAAGPPPPSRPTSSRRSFPTSRRARPITCSSRTLYGPTFTRPAALASSLGAVLSGGDRLEIHRWALAGYYQFIGGRRRRLVRLLEPAARAADAVARAAQFTFKDVPPVLTTSQPSDRGLHARRGASAS